MIDDSLLSIGLLMLVAKLLEGIFRRARINSIVAYTIAGIILGPLTGLVQPTVELQFVLSIGVFIFFFLIGLDEIDITSFVAVIRGRFFVAATISVLISLAVALTVTSDILIDFGLGLDFPQAVALAGTLALSSLGVVAKVLADDGRLREPLGLQIFTTVIIAELIALLVVGFTIETSGHAAFAFGSDGTFSVLGVLVLVGGIVGFTVASWLLSTRVLPRVIVVLKRVLNVPQLSFGLLLGGLLAVLLAGIAVALAANRYARRHFDHVGVLKTLGATPREIQWGYLGVLLVIGVVGTLLGLALGGVVHLGIIAALGDLLPPTLPLPGLRPLVVGTITGFICLLAFALPPLLGLKKISPMRVIRRDLGTGVAPIVTYSFAAVGSLGLLIWHSGSVILTVAALIGAVVTGGTFAVLALILLRGGRVIGMQAGSTWRLALAGLQRRYRENVAQIVIFGFAIMLLLVMLLVRTALVEDWQAEIPESTPNHFLMNVVPSEAQAVQRLLTERTDYDGALFPMIRGRINAVNDVPAREWRRRVGPRPGPGIRSERNLTFSPDLPDNNVVVEGEWWSVDGPPAASLEDDYASGIGVSVGDTLTFDIAGLPLTVPVTNLRSVEWDSLQPNFFIIFSPGTLDEYPATFMTSFHLSREEKPFLNELLSAHPTITLIEVDEIINQVRSIIDRVTQTVELVLYLVLGAGVLVLIASIGSSRDQRLREHALLRALGGTRPLIQGALVTEFAILGIFAGIVAVIGAEITVFTLNRELFELPTSLHFWLWATGPAIGMAMIATVGYLGTRKLVSSPPATVLREV